MTHFDVLREIRELKNHLCYPRSVGFFFGAGTSCALGIPDIAELTKSVESAIPEAKRQAFARIKDDLAAEIKDRPVNIEDILNQLRRIRELTNESTTKSYLDVCGDDAAKIDEAICKAIYQIITDQELKASLVTTERFFAWYNLLSHEYPKEIFTTNYDLVIERALEASNIPYFDGFVGSYEPFFLQESVEHFPKGGDFTKNWIRLWKVHGSLSWVWRLSETDNSRRIIRIGNVGNASDIKNELVIYPSKDKYDSSRKQPFLAYFDRMRSYLLGGELLFIVSGYSFSDQHVNEVIFNSMRQNNRLFVIAFLYHDEDVERLHKSVSPYLNMHAFGPKTAIIGGELGQWSFDPKRKKPNEVTDNFWCDNNSQLTLGDFNCLVSFLIATSGKREDGDKS